MKPAILLLVLALVLPASAEIKRQERKSLLDSEPGVVYLERSLGKPFELNVLKEAPVFSDKEGKHRLGTLKGRTNVEFEDGIVTALEESEDRQGGNVRIVVPPLVLGW